ncbi:transcription initiation factor TFIID subunit [Trichophyton tonsurans CBS 112818]|uniref:Transcription initiation factor TFIID subunit n=2 Tax=Trichophyton TaxID=5550 RepID=F2PZT7_TRIEC|nr:transcription initiation factor TFIID subunit [Trichophyton tonsurans CBS 112818]EGE07405.1 transcription initiation factor TFIID subunit [Trichophyton equinum CBS 127.97]
MSGPAGAPSPGPRSASTGPGNGVAMPSQHQQPISSGPSSGGATPAVPNRPGPVSQQDLNQIVIDYLAKKGYNRTEAIFRMESSNQEIDGRPLLPVSTDTHPKFRAAFEMTKLWVEDNLEIYKPELRRVLWPLFVYSYLNLIKAMAPLEGRQFFEANKNLFLPEHTDDIRALQTLGLPEHVQDNNIAKLYLDNKYRLTLSNPAFSNLMQFLETKHKEGGTVMSALLSSYCTIITKDRASDDRFSFGAMLARGKDSAGVPAEDEGIPGHHPGSAYTGDNPGIAGALPRLKLGQLPPEATLEGDVRGELEEEDSKEDLGPGKVTLIQHFDQMIKKEEDLDAPSRSEIPYPPSTARDVAMEVQKVKENRDRFKIEGRSGGVAPGVSVCMFTFHNANQGITCMDFSGDNALVAVGMQDSYIRVWSLDGLPIPPTYPDSDDSTPKNSHRLYGHSGPVYAVSFAPSIASPDDAEVKTNARWLLSSSADQTIRLWSLDLWRCIVVYKGHAGPVWSLSWGPFGHYFVSGGHDKTARLWVTNKIRQQRIFVGHDQDVDCVCFHPNSAYVFTASSDHTVRMWSVSTGNAVRMFTGHTGNITAVCCSNDGRLLASADDHGTIIIWDLAPGKLLKRMRGHGKGGIWALSWSAESNVLVSGGADGTVRVWDVAGPPSEASTGQSRVLTESGGGTKIDASSSTNAAPNQSAAAATSVAGAPKSGAAKGSSAKKKKGKDAVVTADQISAFPTKKTPVFNVTFTRMNLVIAGGAYTP